MSTSSAFTRRMLSPRAFFCALFGVFACALAAQQPPAFDMPVPEGQGRLKLALHGRPGTNYVLEISRNLTSWLPLNAVVATNGEADFHYTPATNSRAMYFRARPQTNLPALNVTVGLDTNQQAATVITPEGGGTLAFIDGRGINYTLIVPARAVSDNYVVTMTVVTNLGNLPFASGLLGGVSLSPDGIAFAQTPQLIVQFPSYPAVPLSRVVSYAFGADGTNLRLLPCQPGTNTLMVPLTSLSGVGWSVATLPEILDQGRRMVYSLTAPVLKSDMGPFYNSCYPAEKTRAVFVGKGIENAVHAANQDFAARLAANAQQGQADQLTIGDLDLSSVNDSFYKDNISQYVEEAKTNCALAGAIIPTIIGIERQSELMGVQSPVPDFLGGMCQTFSTCAKKIGDCCKLKGASEQAYIELIGITRQWQLLGCDTTDPEQYCPDCFPGWYGTVTYKDTRSNYQAFSTGDGETDSQYEFTTTFEAYTNLVGSPSGQGYYGITGTLLSFDGAAGSNREHSHQTFRTGCNDFHDFLKTSAIQTNAAAFFQLVWSITNTPPGPPQNGLLLFPDGPTINALVAVPSTIVNTDQSSYTDAHGNCVGSVRTATTYGNDTYTLNQMMLNSSSITGDLNNVTGTWSTNYTDSFGAQVTRKLSWDLHRGTGGL